MNWFSAIIDFLKGFNPLFRVSVWEAALRETYKPADIVIWENNRPCWRPVEPKVVLTTLGPGLHRRIPFFEEVHAGSVVTQIAELKTQHVTSRDGKPVSFSGNIAYRISDWRLHQTKIHDFEHSIKGLAEIYLSKQVREHEWSYLAQPDNLTKVEKSLKKVLNKAGKRWGARITMVGLVTLVQAKQHHLFQSQQMGVTE